MLRYAITDRTRFPGDEQSRQSALIQQAARWSESGIDFVQLREKDLDPGPLATLARRIQAALWSAGPGTRLLINSRADVAVAVRADGVHLTSGPGELTPAQIRTLYAAANLPTPIISISCHTIAEVAHIAASPESGRPTLILFGPVFEKIIPTKSQTDTLISSGTGLDLLQQACTLAAPIPVLALGGITPENTQACLTTGAAGIAAIRLFLR
jgi:thiamine-phosphate pyrophosphorylase